MGDLQLNINIAEEPHTQFLDARGSHAKWERNHRSRQRGPKFDKKRGKFPATNSKAKAETSLEDTTKSQPVTDTLKGYNLSVDDQDIQNSDKEKDTRPAKRHKESHDPKQISHNISNDQGKLDMKDEEEDDGLEGLAEAIALSKAKDNSLKDTEKKWKDIEKKSGFDGQESEQEDDTDLTNIVSFVDERRQMNMPANKRKRILPEDAPIKRRKGLGNVHPLRGELTHAGSVVPESMKSIVSGQERVSEFADLNVCKSLSDYLQEMNFQAPTLVQQQAIPVLLAGKDAMVKAPTGSGKTLAYLVPIINYLQAQSPRINRGDGTFALIVAPTRELCMQIQDVLSNILRRYFWLVAGSLTGGENRGKEKARLRKGVHVIVATPGRLLDHLENTSAFQISELKWLVLDEADRLLDLGFEQKLRQIVKILDERLDGSQEAQKRQTVLLSATMPEDLDALITLGLSDPVFVGFDESKGTGKAEFSKEEENNDSSEQVIESFSIPEQLDQRYLQVPGRQRLAALAAIMCKSVQRKTFKKMLVFMSSCDSVEFHHHLLKDAYPLLSGNPLVSCPIWKLHGDLPQGERTRTFLDFNRCAQGILICTDVAARGLDFPAVTHVIQFDPPGEVSEYVHRVGRTARMGQKGESYLFLLPSELEYLVLLHQKRCDIQECSLSEAYASLPILPGQKPSTHASPQDEPLASVLFTTQMTRLVSKDPHMISLAGDAFRSFVRAYATHPSSLKYIFHVKKLHLGHIAGSFALKSSPTLLGNSMRKEQKKSLKRQKLGRGSKQKSRKTQG